MMPRTPYILSMIALLWNLMTSVQVQGSAYISFLNINLHSVYHTFLIYYVWKRKSSWSSLMVTSANS